MIEIEGYIGYLLIQILKRHRGMADDGLNAIGLHAGQEMVLFHLYRQDGMTLTQLADALSVEPPTVTKMVQRLISNDLLEKRQDSEDARVSRVYLTEKAKALREPVSAVWSSLENRLLENLTPTEQALLRRLLAQMLDNLT